MPNTDSESLEDTGSLVSSSASQYGSIRTSPNDNNRAVVADEDDEDTRKMVPVTYAGLLGTNPSFRHFWLSFVVNRTGDWLTLLASISLIGDVVGTDDPHYNTLVSILMVTKSLPNVVFMPLGGVLADSCDRRKVQIALNAASAGLVVLFVGAYQHNSVGGILVANFLQDALTGVYAPSESAMVPQLVDVDRELKKATTLMSLTWSLMAASGSALGGLLVAHFGILACYVIDAGTYLLAMLLLWLGVEGNFDVTKMTEEPAAAAEETPLAHKDSLRTSSSVSSSQRPQRRRRTSSWAGACEENPLVGASVELHHWIDDENQEASPTTEGNRTAATSSNNMFVGGLLYAFVEEPLVGSYALLKGSRGFASGAVSVLNVAFSRDDEDPSKSIVRMGSLFAFIGVGSILGAVVSDFSSDLTQPKRMARICIAGFFVLALGCGTMGAFSAHFAWVCLGNVVRSIGGTMIWVDSSLLIQKFTPPALLGRVNAIDKTASLLGESLSNLGAGLLMDRVGVSPEGVAFLLAGLGIFFFVAWSPLAVRAPSEPPH